MKGMVYIDPAGLAEDVQLQARVDRGLVFVSLPG